MTDFNPDLIQLTVTPTKPHSSPRTVTRDFLITQGGETKQVGPVLTRRGKAGYTVSYGQYSATRKKSEDALLEVMKAVFHDLKEGNLEALE